MQNDYYVYCYMNPLKDMEPFYIGKGKRYRWKRHTQPSALACNSHKTNTIKSIINAGFEIEECIIKVEENLTEIQALMLEAQLIKEIGRRDLGLGSLTNKNDGGESGANVSRETREQIGKSLKEYWRLNPDKLLGMKTHPGQFRNRGDGNGNSKLTEESVIEIKRKLSLGHMSKLLAAEYGVTPLTISKIKNGKAWAHIPSPKSQYFKLNKNTHNESHNNTHTHTH